MKREEKAEGQRLLEKQDILGVCTVRFFTYIFVNYW